ncbi:MAG: secretin N-terminal domain-containing protein [Syntrophales bacterium]|nr:secretin N-terminal domain-containing protein [Syntrophales bacterium]
MKQAIVIVFCALLLAVSFFTGCAGPTTQIKDKGVKVEAEGGTKVPGTVEAPAEKASVNEKGREAEGGAKPPGTAETPAEKTYVDKEGKIEIRSTPFGYVKQDIKRAEKGLSAPVPGQREPVVPPTPVVKAPAAPPALGAEPASPAPGPSEKLAETKTPEDNGQVSFDFDDADIYAVIRTMADLLKINYIIDPTVSGKVTIHTAGLLKVEDIFPVFYQTLEVNGLTAVKEGNVYRILKLKDASRMPIASRLVREAKDIPPEERIIIQIIPLKFISAQEVTKVITPFISADGTIISEEGSNTLLVVDKGINIFKVLKLVEVFDVSVFEKINYRFYTLENINAEDAVKLLREVSLSAGGSKDDVKFIPINRLNTLLIVSSSPDVFGRVDAFIRQIDIPGEGAQSSQIYIYSVKNGMATELGEILKSIFGKGGEITKGAGKESVPTNPFAKGYTEKKTTGATSTTAATSAPATPAATAATATGPSVTLRGDIRITTDSIRNALIIEAIPGDYQIVEKILGRLDVLPRQVLIEVVIAEISLGKGTELGIEWTFKKDNWTDTGSLSASVGASGLQYALGLSQKWQATLHALANDSKLNIISSPSVLASDNKQAKIDVTTEVPIPSTSYNYISGGENVLETKVEYRNTGVILDVTPHINEYGLVTMDISQEVSNVGTLLKVAGKDYYSFDTRKILTSLTVKHNQSIVIGGLISSKKSDAASGVPWLVKIPLIRWLFGTETKSLSKSELIVMITPHVITSLDDVDAVSEEFKKKIGNVINVLR